MLCAWVYTVQYTVIIKHYTTLWSENVNEQIWELITRESFAGQNGHYKLTTCQCENTISSAFTLLQGNTSLILFKIFANFERFVGIKRDSLWNHCPLPPSTALFCSFLFCNIIAIILSFPWGQEALVKQEGAVASLLTAGFGPVSSQLRSQAIVAYILYWTVFSVQ